MEQVSPMSKTKNRIPLARGQQLAAAIIGELQPGCERIEVAGSIRRRRPDIGDIEIVCIPKVKLDLLGNRLGTHLDAILDALVQAKRLEKVKGGDLYRQYLLPKHDGVKLDLFITDTSKWACIFTIRTGPASFSSRLVATRALGGLTPFNMRFNLGRLWYDGAPMETPEERDVFTALGLEWIEPWNRS